MKIKKSITAKQNKPFFNKPFIILITVILLIPAIFFLLSYFSSEFMKHDLLFVPAPQYVCYPSETELNADGTISQGQNLSKLENTTAYEGKGINNKSSASFIERPDTNTVDIQTNKIFCRDDSNGKEIDKPYTVVRLIAPVEITSSLTQSDGINGIQFTCYSENTRIKGDGTLVENQQNITEIKDSLVIDIENSVNNQTRKAFTSAPSLKYLDEVQNQLSCVGASNKNEISQPYVIVKK